MAHNRPLQASRSRARTRKSPGPITTMDRHELVNQLRERLQRPDLTDDEVIDKYSKCSMCYRPLFGRDAVDKSIEAASTAQRWLTLLMTQRHSDD